jgi:hypothetical protein
MEATYDFRNKRDCDGSTIVDVVRTDKNGEKVIAQNWTYAEARLIIDADKIGLKLERAEAERDIYKKVVMAVKGGLYKPGELKKLAKDAVGIAEKLGVA